MPIVRTLVTAAKKHDIPFILKASYDKANRTSIHSFRGLGVDDGLALLEMFKAEFSIPVTTDVHTVEEAEKVGKVIDLIQIPALLSRQTDLLVAAGRTGKPVNIKKGQFMSPYDIGQAVEKVQSTGNTNVLVTERGYSFGYNQLIADMRSLEIMKQTGCPVVFDAAHSVQLPSGLGSASGGQRELIPPLARAGIAVGIAALFLEVYDDPDKAPVDGMNSLKLEDLDMLLKTLTKIDAVVKERV